MLCSGVVVRWRDVVSQKAHIFRGRGLSSFAIDLVACSIRGVGDQGCDHILQYTSRHRKRIRQLRAPSLLESSGLVPLLLLPAPRQAGRDCSALCVLFSYSLLCALVCGR